MASTDTSKPEGLRPARRTIVKGAAWAVPAIAVAAPAHAVGASQCDAFSFGDGSFKCAGQSTGFNFGYGLRFCLNSSCLPGAIDGQTVTIRLDLGVRTNQDLEPVFPPYTNPVITIDAGDTNICTTSLYTFGSSNSNSQVTFYYQVGGGEAVPITITAPPSCTPQVVPNVVGMTVEEAETALNATGLQLGDVTYDGTDPGTGLITSQTPTAGTMAVPLTVVDVTVNSVEPAGAAESTGASEEATEEPEAKTTVEEPAPKTESTEPAPGADTDESTAGPTG